MPGLTVTEKEHWKERIARRIDKRIDALWAENPALNDQIKRLAQERTVESLGLTAPYAELEAAEHQQKACEQRADGLKRSILAQLQHVAPERVHGYDVCQFASEFDRIIAGRKAIHTEELLGQSDLGRRILRLRQEREELLDTVWLATSPREIRELWSKVVALLGDEQTALQREALAIQPAHGE